MLLVCGALCAGESASNEFDHRFCGEVLHEVSGAGEIVPADLRLQPNSPEFITLLKGPAPDQKYRPPAEKISLNTAAYDLRSARKAPSDKDADSAPARAALRV